MQAILNSIKQSADERESDTEDEGNDFEGDSSCGRSFSGDELSESDLKQVHGSILGALKRFDEVFNKSNTGNFGNRDKTTSTKERAEQKKARKLKEASMKEQIEQKRKRKQKREDLMMAAKHAQPAETMPF